MLLASGWSISRILTSHWLSVSPLSWPRSKCRQNVFVHAQWVPAAILNMNHNGPRLNIIDWTWWVWIYNIMDIFVKFLMRNLGKFLCKSLWDWVKFIKLILWISKITKIAHKICIKGGNCRNFSSDNSMEEHYGFIHILVNGKYQRHLSQYRYKCISEIYE